MITLRNGVSEDLATIEAVTAAAFENAEHTDHNEHLIVRALQQADALTVSLVAEKDGVIVGHAAISPVTISSGASGWFGLGPVSVLPAHQKQGIGSQLIKSALNIIRSQGAVGCVVLGDPYFYANYGFIADPHLTLPGVPAEYFQSTLFTGALPTGTVSYHPAFNAA